MQDERPSAANRNQDRSLDGIQRLDLLGWRFSTEEIQRLSRLQERYRAGLDRLDLPLDPYRLGFAHWLVEHGKLSEERDRGQGEPQQEGVTIHVPGCQGSLRASTEGVPTGYPGSKPELQGDSRNPCTIWRLGCRALSWVWHGIAKASEYSYEPDNLGW